MPHILVAGKLHASGIKLLRAATARGFTFDYVEEVSEPSYAPLVHRADALLIRTQPLSGATVALAERLRVVSRHGVGYDAINLPALNARGIALTIVGDVNSVSVAEHTLMLLLSAAKRVLRADKAVRNPNHWNWRDRLEAEELQSKRLLVVGYGRIGRHVARLAQAFGMDVAGFDPFLAASGWPTGPVTPVASLGEGLAWADVISVNVPRADRPLLGNAELAQVRPGCIIINTARGGIVDETALAAALASGRVGAAGLDVFSVEPPHAGNPLFGFDQVVLSPHIAGLTAECAERMAIASVQNIIDFFDGSVDSGLVVNGAHLASGVYTQ
jgi:D-3-phosphoglycerate dehydrogenase